MTHPYLKIASWPGVTLAVSLRGQQGQEFDLSSAHALSAANFARLRQDLNLQGLSGMNQVHGRHLIEVHEDNCQGPMPEADGLYTTTAGLGLMVRQADCQAVALVGPGVVANLHVGWRGNVQNLPGRGLAYLCWRFSLFPRQFRAFISPSLGPCCAEFINYRDEFPPEFAAFMVSPNHFNLWAISAWQLISQGLLRSHLQINGQCTKCGQDFYSFRRGDAGRFATIAALQEK